MSASCPVCGRPAAAESRPFCTARCKDIDLQRWLSGSYAIPVIEEDGGELAAEPDEESERTWL